MRKPLKTSYNSWYQFRTVWLVLIGVLSPPGPPRDYPRPLGMLWEGSSWYWVHSRPTQMVFLDQMMILTSYTHSSIFGQFGLNILASIHLLHTWTLPPTAGGTVGRVLMVLGPFQITGCLLEKKWSKPYILSIHIVLQFWQLSEGEVMISLTLDFYQTHRKASTTFLEVI